MCLPQTASASHEVFPGDLPSKHFPSACLQGPHSFTQLQWGKKVLFPQNTEKKEEKYCCGIGAEEWTPKIPGHFTPAPMGVEIWLHPRTGATAVCTKPPGASCCPDADVWRDQGATLSGAENDIARVPLRVRKARNIKERAPNSPNTAAGCQENPLPPAQAALHVESSET